MIELTNRITCMVIVSLSWELTLEYIIWNSFGKWRGGCLAKWIFSITYKYL